MSIWLTKREPGKRKTIFTISIPWQALPLFIILFASVVGICFRWLGSQWNKPTINSRKDIAGSYRILVCDGPCDLSGAGNVLRQGILVLQNEPLTAEGIADFIFHS
jgi:hypothetical protein